MKVEITLIDEGRTELIVENSDTDTEVWITIKCEEVELSTLVCIEELKIALRKICVK